MFELLSHGSYCASIAENNGGAEGNDVPALTNLRDLVAPLCRERYRRIDRFIQLSLLGSGLCAERAADSIELQNTTDLYMASAQAAIGNTVEVQQQIFKQHQHAKPVNFINTLSNTAGYYVARNLGLNRRNLFVSRGSNSFEAALQLIALDFASGVSQQALLGVVDECLEPLDEHRQRLGLSADAVLAEGSHWMLLRPLLGPAIDCRNTLACPHTLIGQAALYDWLHSQELANVAVSVNAEESHQELFGPGVVDVLSALPEFQANIGYYGSRSAGVVAQFLAQDSQASLISINPDSLGRFHVMRVN